MIGLQTVGETGRSVHRDASTFTTCHGVTKGARRIGSWQHARLRRKRQLRENKQAYRQLGQPPKQPSSSERSHTALDHGVSRGFLIPLGLPAESDPRNLNGYPQRIVAPGLYPPS